MVKKVILSSLLCYCTLHAEVFTLSDAANEVVHTHPEVQEKLHNFKSAIESHNYSKSGFFLPKIDFALSLGSETTKSATTRDKYKTLFKRETSLKLVENLFNGYQTTNDINEQKENYISASLSIIEKSNEIAITIAQTYLNILKQKKLLLLEDENIKIHQDILTQIQAKVDSGFSPLSDSLQVQTRYTLAISNKKTKINELKNELTKFHKILGRFVDINDFKDPSYNFSVPGELNNAIMFALKNNPTIKIANHNVLAKKYAYEKTKGTQWPSIDFIANIENNDNTGGTEKMTERYYVGVSLKYNLFNGYADSANAQKNISIIQQENDLRNTAKRNIIESVMLSFNTYTALAEKETILQQHLDYANKTNTAYQEEFKIGKRTLLDVLNMEVEFNSAKKESVINKYDMLIAKYQLASNLGTLSNKIGISVDNIANLHYSDKNPHYKKDTLPLNLETDHDNIVDMQDICDKSLTHGNTNRFGCKLSGFGELDIKQETPIKINNNFNAIPIEKKQPKQVKPTNFMDDMTEEIPDEEIPEEEIPEIIIPKEEANLNVDNSFIEDTTPAPINLEKDFIYFEYGSSKLTNNSKRLLDIIINKLQSNNSLKLELTGYTDNLGPKRRNEIRSKSRANNVKVYLVEHGVNGRNITVFGAGQNNPIATNDTKEGRSVNRRVEFKFINSTQEKSYTPPIEKSIPKRIVPKRTVSQKKINFIKEEEKVYAKEEFSETTIPSSRNRQRNNSIKNANNEDIEMIEVDF